MPAHIIKCPQPTFAIAHQQDALAEYVQDQVIARPGHHDIQHRFHAAGARLAKERGQRFAFQGGHQQVAADIKHLGTSHSIERNMRGVLLGGMMTGPDIRSGAVGRAAVPSGGSHTYTCSPAPMQKRRIW